MHVTVFSSTELLYTDRCIHRSFFIVFLSGDLMPMISKCINWSITSPFYFLAASLFVYIYIIKQK